jgi:hypothetical protein
MWTWGALGDEGRQRSAGTIGVILFVTDDDLGTNPPTR